MRKVNYSNYDGNCTARHCLSWKYEIPDRWIFVRGDTVILSGCTCGWSCIVLRAWSGAAKCVRLCALEQEQSCGKYWGDECYCKLLRCSFQFEGKYRLNCAVHCKQFPTDTHTHTEAHARKHARSAETQQSLTFHLPASLYSLHRTVARGTQELLLL